jgi:predicted DNA-binding protein
MTTIQLPEEIDERFTALADSTKRSKNECILEALEQFLEDLEDARAADAAYEEFLASGKKTTSLEEVIKKYGLDD